MDEKIIKEDNFTELNINLPAIKASQEILANISRVYISPQLTNLNRTVQEIGQSMLKVTNSPAMEQIANLNQVFVDSAFKFYGSPAKDNLTRINQEISESMAIISNSLAMGKMTVLNQHLVEFFIL